MHFAALVVMSLPLSVALLAQAATPMPRAVIADPVRDARAPAASIGVRIPSGGVQMNGFLMQASGTAPHPLANALRSAGAKRLETQWWA